MLDLSQLRSFVAVEQMGSVVFVLFFGLGDLTRGTRVAALEHEMLEEMGKAGFAGRFCRRAALCRRDRR